MTVLFCFSTCTVYQGRDAFAIEYQIQPAQLSCLSGSVGRVSAWYAERHRFESHLRQLILLGVVALPCLVSITEHTCTCTDTPRRVSGIGQTLTTVHLFTITHTSTYMNNHMHSAPQSKKEENREERKKNHTLYNKAKSTTTSTAWKNIWRTASTCT